MINSTIINFSIPELTHQYDANYIIQQICIQSNDYIVNYGIGLICIVVLFMFITRKNILLKLIPKELHHNFYFFKDITQRENYLYLRCFVTDTLIKALCFYIGIVVYFHFGKY